MIRFFLSISRLTLKKGFLPFLPLLSIIFQFTAIEFILFIHPVVNNYLLLDILFEFSSYCTFTPISYFNPTLWAVNPHLIRKNLPAYFSDFHLLDNGRPTAF